MRRLKNKLILSIVMIAFTAITLVSTTYAWFSSNVEAWFDDFDLEIQNVDGLLASIDGVNYYSEIDEAKLKKAVVAKFDGLDIIEDNEVLTNSYVNDRFSKLELAPVSTSDLVNFTTVDNACTKANGYYQPRTADAYSYLSFDLYLKVQTSKGKANKNYNISFVGNSDESRVSDIKSGETSVKLSNEAATQDATYNPGDIIKVDPKDSMRIGIIHDDATKTIYEPYSGLGSYALDGNTDSEYDPNKNAMFTYFNNSHNTKLQALDNLDVYKNTVKSFDNDVVFGTCVPNATNTDYEAIKLTVCIWIEGYDADYFVGVDNDIASFYLSFKMKEVI
ncbi:MAG: hypothetical protein E7176_05780 [Erysipelotrichaceae bacterium]|nr:hypothetical protein [Erysipelotrichaceae bacterium]